MKEPNIQLLPSLLLCRIILDWTDMIQNHQTPLVDGTPLNYSFAHGLGRLPQYVRCVLLCTTNDSGLAMTVGQEIDADGNFDTDTQANDFCVTCDATNIYLTYSGTAGTLYSFGKNGSFLNPSNLTHFSLKVYFA